MNKVRHSLLLILMLLSFYACIEEMAEFDKKDRELFFAEINPEDDPNGFSQALRIDGDTLTGLIPESNNSSVTIINFQNDAALSSGTTLFLPFNYIENVSDAISGINIQVEGASHYYKVDKNAFRFSSSVSENYKSVVIPIEVPEYITAGNAKLNYAAVDNQGRSSNMVNTRLQVGETVSACVPGGFSTTGSSGLYVQTLQLGDSTGTVNIRYNTFTIPDRMDIRYNNEWVGSTAGSLLGADEIPPSSICYDGTEGYVGRRGTISVEYDARISSKIEIYMSGCYERQTRWDYSVSCNEDIAEEPKCCEVENIKQPYVKKTVRFNANHEGKLNTGIDVNKGDYVFMSNFFAQQATSSFGLLGDRLSFSSRGLNLDTERKKYPEFRYGQLILHNGDDKIGFGSITSKGVTDCGQESAIKALFSIDNGDYFIAQNAGPLMLELNDDTHSDNTMGFNVNIYVMSKKTHEMRNQYNCCPALEPVSQEDECDDSWSKDGKSFSDCFHGGLDVYRLTKGKSGFQCAYRNGKLMNVGGDQGTFDFRSAGAVKLGLKEHYRLDVLPHFILGNNYTPTPASRIK